MMIPDRDLTLMGFPAGLTAQIPAKDAGTHSVFQAEDSGWPRDHSFVMSPTLKEPV